MEPIRVDEYTGDFYTFFMDPDGLPLELKQCAALVSDENYAVGEQNCISIDVYKRQAQACGS